MVAEGSFGGTKFGGDVGDSVLGTPDVPKECGSVGVGVGAAPASRCGLACVGLGTLGIYCWYELWRMDESGGCMPWW